MTDLIKLARECGAMTEMHWYVDEVCAVNFSPDQLALFAHRVRAEAMEEAANKCYAMADNYREQGVQLFEDAARECGSALRALSLNGEDNANR